MRISTRLLSGLSPVLIGFSGLGASACGDEAGRPLGAVCEENGECESGLCVANICLDPAGDADGDGLTNAVEASLKTNPTAADTDGDGKPDAEEIGDPARPTDTDGDGVPDILESATADADVDCIPDEVDPIDAGVDPNGCGAGDVVDSDVPEGDVAGDTSSPTDTSTTDTTVSDASADASSPDGTAGDIGPVEDTTPADLGGDTSPPPAACGPSEVVVAPSAAGVLLPWIVGQDGEASLFMFQRGVRQHYATVLGHGGWTAPELVASGVDINPNNHPDAVATTNKLRAFRAEVIDAGQGVLGTWSWRSEAWAVSAPLAGLGQGAGNHVLLADESVLAVVANNYGRDLDLVRWTRADGFATPTPITRYPSDQVFDTAMAIDPNGDGAIVAFIAPGLRLDAWPVVGGAPVAGTAGVNRTGTDDISTGFKAVLLPDGGVLALWEEASRRLVAAEFTHADGVGTWRGPAVVHEGNASVPTVALDGAGAPVVVFLSAGREVWTRREADGSWREAADLGPAVGLQRLLATDAAGSVWTAWVDASTFTVHVLRLVQGAAEWEEVDAVAAEAGTTHRERAQVVIGQDGRVLVVWSEVSAQGTGAVAIRCQ